MAHPHFVTGDFKSHAFLLPDEEYARALDCIVKATVDVVITSQANNKILLGKRRVEPQADWWFMGGRLKPGETVERAASRILKRELGLQIDDVERYETVGHYTYVWDKRAQAPVDHGTADISIHLALALTQSEIEAIKMDPEEYGGAKWVEPEEVTKPGAYHPAMTFSIRDLLSNRRLRRLRDLAMQKDVSDADVRASLMEFFDTSNYYGAKRAGTIVCKPA